ncbi:cation transporter [Acidiphilium sp.]|uniref:cation transporter n=1 Tax=Acidiphilium sp. TaxID=527 RepID=UPI0025911BDC|nr:cation transporter [Acidiphilium sp.]
MADHCCAPERSNDSSIPSLAIAPPEPSLKRATLIRQAFRLEWLTVGWMIVEAAVAIGAAVAAHSLSLAAFGLDSVIELASAGVLIWRLTVELRHGQVFSERAERLASRAGGALLFGLAVFIVVGAAWSIAVRHGEAFSIPGLIVTVLAMPIMAFLARRKIALANQLGSRAMRADAVESITCGWLSLVVVIGLIADLLIGAWWVDSVTSLAIVWFVVKEAREAWSGEECEACKS